MYVFTNLGGIGSMEVNVSQRGQESWQHSDAGSSGV
jgi:hypothetical protein